MASTFSNWSGLITSSPEIIRSIGTLEEAKEAVNYAQEQRIPIRTVGSTHSHSPIFHNDHGMIITTENLTGPITINERNSTATIPAGMKLSAATRELWNQGPAAHHQHVARGGARDQGRPAVQHGQDIVP